MIKSMISLIKINDIFCLVILGANIIFLLYFSVYLLIFTDEFAIQNLGFYNHSIAGLSEIIGIIFFCLAVGLVSVIIRGANKQLPLLITIFLMQIIISLNFYFSTIFSI